MTDETKLQILNYIVNNINPTAPNDDEIFAEKQLGNNTMLRYLIAKALPENMSSYSVRFEGMVAGNELTTDLTVVYGGIRYYKQNDSTAYFMGLIVLMDENFNPIKVLTEFTSGTKLRYIQYMKQESDGTFYYIDDTNFPFLYPENYNSEKRFVMTTNFTIMNQVVGDYTVGLRKTYNLPSDYKNFYCKNMYSDPNTSHYIFFGQAGDGTSWRNMKIFSLKIIVGATNEWNMYYNQNGLIFGSAIALFDDENVKFRCLCVPNISSSRTIDCVSKTYTGNVGKKEVVRFSYKPYIDTNNMAKQSVFQTYDSVYFVQNNQHWGISGTPNAKYLGLYKYDFNTSVLTTIYENSLGNYDYCNLENMYIDTCNTDLYILFVNNINSHTEGSLTYNVGDYYFQRLVNDTWQPKLVDTQKQFNYFYKSLFVKNNFNLLKAFIYTTGSPASYMYDSMIKEDYNPLNYNGTPYIDYDCLVSRKGQIYSNNRLVFARNLYNKFINNNTTMSTIQIPNNYLNGISLDLKKLISNTNLDICNENNITNKNIYEMVFVNYINQLNVVDEDTGLLYNEAASYINTNINTGTKANCESTFIGKVRINFTSPEVKTIEWTWNVDHYETSFTFYTSEIPSSFEFISEDESTTYLIKTLEGLETNKYYTTSQKLRIE